MDTSSLHGVERNPDAAARRLMQIAQNRDGLPEIAIGIVFLTAAFLLWLQVAFRPGSLPYRTSSSGITLLLVPMIVAMPWAITSVRRRFLMDRVGYVEPRPTPPRRSALAIGIAIIVAVITVLAVLKGMLPSAGWLLAATGILGGFLIAYTGRLPRFAVGGVLMAAAGITVGVSRVPLELGLLILFGLMGTLATLSGCVVFLHFLRMPREDE